MRAPVSKCELAAHSRPLLPSRPSRVPQPASGTSAALRARPAIQNGVSLRCHAAASVNGAGTASASTSGAVRMQETGTNASGTSLKSKVSCVSACAAGAQ
jgi:hypothetical protein